jgi:protein-tyrosine phosphatase
MIGLTPCPGTGVSGPPGARRRIDLDVRQVRNWKAQALVSALEDEEMRAFGVLDIGVCSSQLGIWWYRVPLKRDAKPDQRFWHAWPKAAPSLLQLLRSGQRLSIHCDETAGRAGLVAACLLQEMGHSAAEALQAVRALPCAPAIGPAQERFIREYLPQFPEHTRLRSS